MRPPAERRTVLDGIDAYGVAEADARRAVRFLENVTDDAIAEACVRTTRGSCIEASRMAARLQHVQFIFGFKTPEHQDVIFSLCVPHMADYMVYVQLWNSGQDRLGGVEEPIQ
jgi:hypothetical protein